MSTQLDIFGFSPDQAVQAISRATWDMRERRPLQDVVCDTLEEHVTSGDSSGLSAVIYGLVDHLKAVLDAADSWSEIDTLYTHSKVRAIAMLAQFSADTIRALGINAEQVFDA